LFGESVFTLNIKNKLIGILAIVGVIIICSVISQNIVTTKNDKQTEEADVRYYSYILANEFRQTSLDLTRLCRTFISTGDIKYYNAYWDIVKWRNGELARPNYVDEKLYPGIKKKQTDIMKELEFSSKEFELLTQAGNVSNALIDTETQAMESIKQGKIVSGPFSAMTGESLKEFATRIVFSENYHNEANKVMAPVKLFFTALNERTSKGLLDSQKSASKWLNFSLALQVLTALSILILIYILMHSLFKPLQKAIDAMQDIGNGEGDLKQRLVDTNNDELSDLGKGFNLFAHNIQTMIIELRSVVDRIFDTSSELSSTANLTDQAVVEQKTSIANLLVSIEQMLPAVQEIANSAVQGVEQANLSEQAAKTGLTVVNQAIANINSLEENIDGASNVIQVLAQDTENIGSVLDVIRGIADQTNLLALNAAIEAARAGEQGRGFAVVADEVRTLAQRTQDSTAEIQKMIEKLQLGSKNAVQVMQDSKSKTKECVDNSQEAGESLNKISEAVIAITSINDQVAAATEEQTATMNEIRVNVNNINQQIEQTSAGSKKTAENSDITAQLTENIRALISKFKT